MGRGLSPLQRNILHLAADHRVPTGDRQGRRIEAPDLPFGTALRHLFGPRLTRPEQNAAKASLSRSFRRLRGRQLMARRGASFYLTEAGMEEARRLQQQESA